ncbi:hypothetical protein GWK47_024335 [Chionoecetes opilio]|uniref:Uncharacterized protein n=1 Tax=Chionoecetes opilio TaxID=41210 RepID=A0A8J4XLE9_CHIOP|nr:hypothetical protein GWK47_024335 [Chionoecetes opilio]
MWMLSSGCESKDDKVDEDICAVTDECDDSKQHHKDTCDLLKPANKSRDTSQDNFTMAVSKELRGRKVDISEPPPAVQRQASRRPATRSATETFLIGYPSSSISGSQLPTNRQAFQYFLHLQSLPENTGNPKHQDLANETAEAIIPFWQMARIKTMTKYNAAQHFMTLHKKHRDLARNKGRTGDPGGKRSAFVLELDSLFDIGASDAIQEIERNRLLSREKKDKDIRLYQDQKTERKAHMSGHDKIFESRSQQQAERAARLQQREEQDMNLSQNFYNFSAATQRRTAADVSTWADPTDSEGNAEDMDYQQPLPGCSHHQDTVTLTFPRRVMECVDICSTANRPGLSDNQVTALVSATLKAGGADLDKFVISTSTTRRNRMLIRYHISQEYMAAFSEDPPKYAALHWDGKMLRDVLGSDPGTTSETLAVLVSGPPAYPEGKLLGVPVIDSSTGTVQAEASMDLLEAWGLTGVITALVFDTTASNSGIHRGAAKLLEQQLDRKVFYLACRHHILEVLVGAVWENLFGKVKSPENPWFKHFKDVWTDLITDNPTTLSIRQKWLNKKKKECKEILQEILRSEKPPRADYREMAELTLIVLGDTPPRGIHWSRPGAIHQARWMARNLYSMKMFMFAEQLEYDEETVVKLERLNLFLGLFYTPMWMSSTLAADAPANDLQFMKDMMKFKRTDPEIAQAVLQKLENHKWYLTQEVVPFALFGSRLSDKEKQDIAAKLHATEKPNSFRRGKPMFPQVTAKTTLADLVGPESHLLLDTLGIEYDWLLQPVATWPRSDDYSKAWNMSAM